MHPCSRCHIDPNLMTQEFESRLLEGAVSEISRLPGIGRKTALRLALHLLREDVATSVALGEAIINMRKGISYCRVCHNISETDICPVCADPRRDSSTVCVVENVKDVLIFEKLKIDALVTRVANGDIKEVILALGATMEGDTTDYYIYKRLEPYNIKVTQLARGVSVGNEIEYTDEITLGRSLLNRTLFSDTIMQ